MEWKVHGLLLGDGVLIRPSRLTFIFRSACHKRYFTIVKIQYFSFCLTILSSNLLFFSVVICWPRFLRISASIWADKKSFLATMSTIISLIQPHNFMLATLSKKYFTEEDSWMVFVSLTLAADIEQLNRFPCGGYSDECSIVFLAHPCIILSALEVRNQIRNSQISKC